MQTEKLTRSQVYEQFLEFISTEVQRERRVVNRRMFSVFIWCFLIPALVSVGLLILVKFNVLPRRVRGYSDWMGLAFPIVYSIYFLSSEVFKEIPNALKRGGIWSVLRDAQKSGVWKAQVCTDMQNAVRAKSFADWDWLATCFRGDLDRLLYRARYLTALAGAVFFLIMQGIDAIDQGGEEPVSWIKDPKFGWVELSNGNFSQFIGLGLFLMLLYLSSSQNYHYLRRYLNCVELIQADLKSRTAS